MTNREKYKFDDFTFENYRRLINLAKEKGFLFILHKDEYIKNRKDIIWRHDVEFEPDYALRMAEIEHELNVKASYFFQIHGDDYNLMNAHYTKVFHRIRELGHHVGLHFDCMYWNISDQNLLDKYISLDREYMEQALGVCIDTFSFHNTTPFTHSCLDYKYGGLINVYSSFFKQRYNYCSDSLGYWRYDRLEDVLNDNKVQHLQVLTHDANWNDVAMSPRKRFAEAMHKHADRLVNDQINTLHSWGHLCPDDNED